MMLPPTLHILHTAWEYELLLSHLNPKIGGVSSTTHATQAAAAIIPTREQHSPSTTSTAPCSKREQPLHTTDLQLSRDSFESAPSPLFAHGSYCILYLSIVMYLTRAPNP